MTGFDPREVRGTPFGAPLVPTFPLRMRDTEILTVIYRTSAEAAERLIPTQLALASDLAAIHLYRMHDADWFGAYGESAVHLPVEHRRSGTRGVYAPFLFVESDGAVAAGREIYGQPKKQGAIELAADGDLLVGRLRRNGIDVVTLTMPYKQRRGAEADLTAHLDFRTNINLKVVSSVDGGMDVCQLTARTFADVVVREVWLGSGTVEIRPNAQAPVHLLPVVEVVSALYWRADFSLVDGVVLESIAG